MEKKGFIGRETDKNDRRKVDVAITANGSCYITCNLNEYQEQMIKIFTKLGKEDSMEFMRILSKIAAITEKPD